MIRPAALALALALLTSVAPVARAGAGDAAERPEAFRIDEVSLTTASPGAILTGVRARIELLAADARAALNGQSADLLIDDDCEGHRLRLRRVQVYRLPHQGGPSNEAGTPADWLPFSNHSYAAQIAEAICARRAELVAAAAAPPAATPGPETPTPAPLPPSPPVGHPIQMAETSAETVSPAPAAASVPSPATGPGPAPVSGPGSQASPPPSKLSDVSGLPAARPTAGGIMVQFLSSPSEAELERAENKLRTRLGADAGHLTFSRAQAVVRGVTRYRGRIGPFESAADARAACATVRESGFPCLPLANGRAH